MTEDSLLLAEGSTRVLVVEDDPTVRALMTGALEQAGFLVGAVDSGRDAIAAARELRPEVVVLDVLLPDMLGTAVCGALRHDPKTADAGVLIVSSRGTPADRIEGLEAGADDYLAKPFHVRELVLRVTALARRAKDSLVARGRPRGDADRALAWRGITIEPTRRRVTIDGRVVDLRPLERKLLTTLMSSTGSVITHAELLRRVWGPDTPSTSRTVHTHVRRLRERLGRYGYALVNAHGVGYRWRDETESEDDPED